MLDERKTAILRAVVQEYITTAQPVGSTHIADLPGVRVSSATVRNEMAVLEQEGYLAQPHTSAGRVPTDKGYRFFVDHITDARPARRRPPRSGSATFFDTAHGRLEELLHQTSNLLAQLTQHAAVVVGPPADSRRRALGADRRPVGAVTRWSSPCSCQRNGREPDDRARRRHVRRAHRRRRRRTCRRAMVGHSIDEADELPSVGRPGGRRAVRRRARGAVGRAAPTSRCSSAARRRWPSAFDAVDTVRTCCARSSSSTSWCRWCATSSTAGSRRDRRRARCRAAGRVLGRRRAR